MGIRCAHDGGIIVTRPWPVKAGYPCAVLRSEDGGAHWSNLVATGIPNTALWVSLLLAASDDANTVCANFSGTDPAADSLCKSVDGGAIWSKIEGYVHFTARVLVESPAGPSVLYTDDFPNGLYRSQDHGDTWSRISALAHLAFAIDPHAPLVICGATDAAEGRATCVVSADGGETWEKKEHAGLPDRLAWVVCDPRAPGLAVRHCLD